MKKEIIAIGVLVAAVMCVCFVTYNWESTSSDSFEADVPSQNTENDNRRMLKKSLNVALENAKMLSNSEGSSKYETIVADLEQRLQDVETLVEENSDILDGEIDSQNSAPRFTDNDLANWMQDSMPSDAGESQFTLEEKKKIEVSMAKLPNVNWKDLKCEKRFCHIQVSSADGSKIDGFEVIDSLPSHGGEFITIPQDDDSIAFYYTTDRSIEFKNLREEAMNKAHM